MLSVWVILPACFSLLSATDHTRGLLQSGMCSAQSLELDPHPYFLEIKVIMYLNLHRKSNIALVLLFSVQKTYIISERKQITC